ncbi:hypothetical protein EZV62_015214 [Acer yangbiense]|uniref:Ubiquitin-like protease family profile domain-containing protein n=1 Tax=Acer yangbiense TaxID=1000413 RepID=A0A5C7HU93_9ROSI|nr:hypothetical protein EZV62_015214 [Acer yangbiense]
MTIADDEFKLFYLHSLQWDPPMVDKSLLPVVCWTNVKIRKCVTRLHSEGGLGTNRISVDDVFEQPVPAERQYDCAAHGETSHSNQQPGFVNNAHIKGMHDVLQVVKDIQATLKTELSDIRTKLNFLYAKYSSVEDKNSEDLHNTNSHQKSKHQSPPNPSPNSPHPPPSRPLIIPTIQNPVVEVSSNNTQTLPQPQQNISKSTPSSMNAPDSHMEEQRIDDLYNVPAVRTVPSLVDEDTLNDDNRELESLSSNKRRIIQTRSTSKRKPNRFQISPYIAGPVHGSTKYRYGPFRIGIQLNIYDEQLIIYIFDKKLPSSDVIIDIGNLRVTRKSFRKLEPTKFLNSEKGKNILCTNLFPNCMSLTCPIFIDVKRSTFLSMIYATIDFSISYADAPNQPNGYDCGLFVCMFMDDNCPTPVQMKSFQSECQRLFWA